MPRKRKDRLEKLKRIVNDAAATPNEKEIAQEEIKRLVHEEPKRPPPPPAEPQQTGPRQHFAGTVDGVPVYRQEPVAQKSQSGVLPGSMRVPPKPKGLPKKS
jgi:hypothetical protein